MMPTRSLLLLLYIVLSPSMALQADEPPTVEDRAEYQLPRTHELLIKSQSGAEYRIFVAEPAKPAPETSFPVLYLLDANACFATAVEALRVQAGHSQATGVVPVIIVGIGYPGDEPFNRERRTLDYTIPADEATLPPRRDGSDWPPHGGADPFLDFIENELQPLMVSRFNMNKQRQAIFGHSFGGLFVLHTLFTRPETFSTYIASSPSVWWGDYAIGAEEQAFGERCRQSGLDVRLKVTTAELEKGHGPAAAMPPTPSSTAFGGAKAMAARLSKLANCGLTVEYHEFPSENHGSVLPISLDRALRFASAPGSGP